MKQMINEQCVALLILLTAPSTYLYVHLATSHLPTLINKPSITNGYSPLFSAMHIHPIQAPQVIFTIHNLLIYMTHVERKKQFSLEEAEEMEL